MVMVMMMVMMMMVVMVIDILYPNKEIANTSQKEEESR